MGSPVQQQTKEMNDYLRSISNGIAYLLALGIIWFIIWLTWMYYSAVY